MIPLEWFLCLSAVLFAIGAIGVLTKRNAIIVLMCIELMLNAANINLVAFSAYSGDLVGQVFAVFSIAVAAAEVAVGLAIVMTLYKSRDTVNVDEVKLLRW